MITSKATALNQVASTFTNRKFDFDDSLILDFGCGKGKSKEFCEKEFTNCTVCLYDPYHNFNQVDTYITAVANNTEKKKTVITCNNVLNVLTNNTLLEVLAQIKKIAELTHTNKIIFKIYEGDKSGIGKITKNDCYQRNEKTENYVQVITDNFNNFNNFNNNFNFLVQKKGLFIICTRVNK